MKPPARISNLAPWLHQQYDLVATLERLGDPTESLDVAAIVNECERVAGRFGLPIGDELALLTPREGLAAIGRLLSAAQGPSEVLTVKQAAARLSHG